MKTDVINYTATRAYIFFLGSNPQILSICPQALPHPSVDSNTFFRHISAEQPPPIRMKQLMSWCARRCIDGQRNKSQTALKIAKQVEDETLSMLIKGEFAMSWINRQEREPIRKIPKKPHLQNVKNLQKLKEYEEQIARLRKEDEEWTNVISSFNTFHASLVDSGPPLPPGDDPIMVHPSYADVIDLDLLTADERSLWEKYCKDKDVAKSTTASSRKALESSAKATSKEQNKWMVDMMSTLEKEVTLKTMFAAGFNQKMHLLFAKKRLFH